MNIRSLASPARMQRTEGAAILSVKPGDSGPRIERLYQEGAAKIRFPRNSGRSIEAVLINTAGGLTGGDKLSWQASVARNCALVLTTQASEKVYRASDGCAQVEARLTVADGASLAWLPQETIIFDRSALERNILVDLGRDSSCLIVESLVFGRAAMGETVQTCRYRDRWRINCDDRLVHHESFRVDGNASQILSRNATGAGAVAFATVLLVAPNAATRLAEARRCLAKAESVTSGASAMTIGQTGKLLARIAATDGYTLRKALTPLIKLLNDNSDLPKIWAT